MRWPRKIRSTRTSGSERCPRHEPLRRSVQARSRDEELVEEAELVVLPFIVLGELRAGFAGGRRQAEGEGTLRRFLLKDNVEVFFADDQTTFHYANLYRQLRHQGTPIPTNDIWIAAIIVQHDLVLHARDKHFDCLPQIVRV